MRERERERESCYETHKMETQGQAAERFREGTIKAESTPDIVEIGSFSEKGSTGIGQETAMELICSMRRPASQHLYAENVHKRPRLQNTALEGFSHGDSEHLNTTAADGFGEFDALEGGSLHDDGNVLVEGLHQSNALKGENTHTDSNITEYEDDVENNDDLPDDFLEPLDSPLASSPPPTVHLDGQSPQPSTDMVRGILRQFWKAGDYDNTAFSEDIDLASGMEHIRVHPKFLHSNATSHKWALGAVAELLDNALDEAVNGATFVSVDMVLNPRDGRPMLAIEDDGGGMDPERMRQCMSLGYSAKSKVANTIGQYGNGFKTSTMRLGADVLVFSRNKSKDGSLPTQSIGLLSYTFLMATGQDDIFVPMVDYEVQPFGHKKLVRGTLDDWNRNLEVLLQWSPYDTEQGLLDQLRRIKGQGTIVVVYNLWEDDEGELELDFDADHDDIQLRGTNRDEKSMSMASKYPHCKHYFTHKYSLRSYASILYLRLPKTFRIILRGKQVTHHKLVSDLMLVEQVKYKPVKVSVLSHKDAVTVVTLGFAKHAKEHIDVQGFNVYHKNRLIRPFWRVWNFPGINGRGIFGVLEANFVEPAHDKQGFERTTVFARLEARLIEIQKKYWSKNFREIGYRGGFSKKKAPDVASVGRSVGRSSNPVTPSRVPVSDTLISPLLVKGQVEPKHSKSNHPLPSIGREGLHPQHMKQSTGGACEVLSRNHNDSESQTANASLGDPKEPVKTILSGLPQAEKSVDHIADLQCGASEFDSNDGRLIIDEKPGRVDSTSSTALKDLKLLKLGLSDDNLGNDVLRLDQPPGISSVSGQLALDVSGPSLQASLMSESLQDSNEALVSPSSQCEMPELLQCTSGDAVNVATQPGQPRTLTRSMLQLRQSHAKAFRLESANLQHLQEPMTSSTTTVSCLVKTAGEDGAPSVTTLVTSSADHTISLVGMDELERKLDVMKQRFRNLQSDLNKACRERDFIRGELEEDRKRRSHVEDELKKRLQALTSRATELEASNALMLVHQRG